MSTTRTLIVTATLLAFLLPGLSPATAASQDRVTERGYDAHGRLAWERGIRTDNEAIAFERVYHHADKAKGPASTTSAVTDCPSTKYSLAGWHWNAPYAGYADQHAAIFTTSGNTWDVETGTDIFGSFQSGVQGTAGQLDGVNQIQFVSLGASTTIAVTTTWYYRGSGEAVESDGQYNTFYQWSTSGEAGKMDVQNIATHEIGHTFGLNHPKGSAASIGCLTMYAYANYGETQKRTLGDGDILGIEAIYGA